LQPLRGLQAEAVDVGNEEQQRDEPLTALRNTELAGLLDRVDCVPAGVGETDDFCPGSLRFR